MADTIHTRSIAKNIAEIDKDFVLLEEPMSRIVFRAQLHEKGVRGWLIRQRRESKQDSWISDPHLDIRKLGKGEFLNFELNTAATKTLATAFIQLAEILREHGVEYGMNKYTLVDPQDIVVTDANKASLIRKLIDSGYSDDVWNELANSGSSIISKLATARIRDEKNMVLHELESRLKAKFSETAGSSSWQHWIYRHNWLFGTSYRDPIEKARLNLKGVMPDYLFPTLDGFIDVLEIKLPSDDVLREDASHVGSWQWSSDTNKAIGQVINYLGEIDRNRLEIEKTLREDHNLPASILKPRAFILIGDSLSWVEKKKQALRKMNHALHGIELITYRDLLQRGQQSLKLLSEDRNQRI